MPPFQVLNSRRRQLTFALVPAFLLATSQLWAASSTVVISQVYTAGGNSGATYNADYVELFNLSSSPVSLSGWSLQYFSATAAATASPVVIAIPGNFTLLPGQRYLISAVAGGTGANLTNTADQTASGLAMGAAAGRIYVANTTVPLSNSAGCPTNYVDFVGYGTTANCFETARAIAPSLSQPIARTNVCVDADNNASEFALTSTAARSSASVPTPCSTTALISNAAVNPSSVNVGGTSLLTVSGKVGLTVSADLSGLGGSKTQPLYDDGSNGDAAANDGTYSFNIAVPSSTAVGSYNLTVSATNTSLMTSTASTTLTVTAPVAFVAIHSIQGNTPGTSQYAGQGVMTHGIVTGVRSAGYYIQARDGEADSDPHTPEGIYIFTGSGNVPATATIGTEIQVSGTVTLYPTAGVLPGVELNKPTNYSVLTTSNPLPAAITLTTTNPGPNGGIQQLLYLQGMRVAVPSLTVTQPTDGTLSEANETYTSNGQFWGEVTGLPRPTREAGLEVRDPLTASQPSTIARFDDDPETFLLDSIGAGNTAGILNVATGAVLNNVTGVVDVVNYTGGLPTVVIDAANRPTVAAAGMTIVATPAAGAGQVTIGDQNMERFYNATADTSGAVVLTQAAYQLRLTKASLGIRNVLNSPDILAIEEMENLQTLTDLSNKISADAVAAGQVDPQYQPYLVQGNDPSAINVAFLVKPSKVNVLGVDQFGKTATYTAPSGTATLLNDRPPLVLHAGVKRGSGAADYPVTVIVNHLRSLNGITDPSTGATVRAKREAQAEYLANLVQGYQQNGEHVVVVGDFNAFDVNDGLVDSLGVIKGNPAPASQDVVAGAQGLVNPILVDAAPTNVAAGAYSYVFEGYAQSIDHFLTTQDIAGSITTQPAHWNADFPVIFRNDATRPEVSTDHDGIVGYLAIPAGQAQAAVTSTISKLSDGSYQIRVTITNSGSATAQAVQLATAVLGSANTTTALPLFFGDIAAGGSSTMVLNFPASAGASGSRGVEKLTGTYTGGTFSVNARVVLP